MRVGDEVQLWQCAEPSSAAVDSQRYAKQANYLPALGPPAGAECREPSLLRVQRRRSRACRESLDIQRARMACPSVAFESAPRGSIQGGRSPAPLRRHPAPAASCRIDRRGLFASPERPASETFVWTPHCGGMSRELWRRLKTARPFFLISGPNVLQVRTPSLSELQVSARRSCAADQTESSVTVPGRTGCPGA